MGTEEEWYADRLSARQGKRWKKLLRVQAPYQWNLRRQGLGKCLDVGCGVGRNLGTLDPGSLGVDHNKEAIATARRGGHEALTVQEFNASPPARASFDGILLAHVIEHMSRSEAAALLETYLPYLRSGGRVFMICPQERGYASDPTHVEWTTGQDLADLARRVGLLPGTPRSFPFPTWAGRLFIYNEFNLIATKP